MEVLKMKKYLTIFICLLIIASFVGCSNSQTEEQKKVGSDERVLDAIDVISEHWNNEYEEREIKDKYLEITNTRIVNIKDDINSEAIYGKDDLFKGIDYIVEFELISNYHETAPYYFNVWQDNFVIVYKDGTTKVSNNILNMYKAATYSTDFSPIIESLEEFHDEYDQILKLK